MRSAVVLQEPMHGGAGCPTREQRLCNTFVCPSATPTPAPSRKRTGSPTPAPSMPGYKPMLQVVGDDVMTLEATPAGYYRDQGALCIDQEVGDISSEVEVSGALFPRLARPGVYELRYECATARGQVAQPATRQVVVRDTTCPACSVRGALTLTVEASFAYHDAGAQCADNLDGPVSTVVTNPVDTAQVGVYFVTYRARDAAGNWNDANGAGSEGMQSDNGAKCTGAAQYVRTVHVVDTLKPAISLTYSDKLIATGAATDTGVGGEDNPAASGGNVANAAATVVLMAEELPLSQRLSSATSLAAASFVVMLGALAALRGRWRYTPAPTVV
jgi:hypothetical protein